MSRMTLSQDQPIDMTLVPNYFIDEYMKDANDAQIKVYLFLLHLVTNGRDTSISDIADRFNYTEKDILRAVSYWEKEGLLNVTCDECGEICSIRFLTPQTQQTGSPAPIVSLVIPQQKTEKAAGEQDKAPRTKADYSLDQLSEMKKTTHFGQILSVAEGYLARNLSPTDIQSLAFIYDSLHFSFELMDFLIEYCVGRGKRKLSYIEKAALDWHVNGITTVEQAKQYLYQRNREVYLVMKALGRHTDPTDVEAEYVHRWYEIYAFDEDVILEACARASLKTDKNRFEYTEGILAKWHAGGIHHMADVDKADREYSRSRIEKSQSTRKTKDSFNNFTQRNYDYDALEKELMES